MMNRCEGGVALQWSPWVVGCVGGCFLIGVIGGLLVSVWRRVAKTNLVVMVLVAGFSVWSRCEGCHC
jgi:hypothetical protein